MSGNIGLPPIPAYLSIVKNEQAAVAQNAKVDVTDEAAVKHFQQVASSIQTPQALLGDYTSLKVILGAFGLSSAIGETAIIKDLMTQNPASSNSLAKRSGNSLWLRFAQQMSGWTSSSTPLQSTTSVSTIASQFMTNQFETGQGQRNPGMQQALYFTRTIASDGGSMNALESDATQLNVVETVLGFDPSQFGALNFPQQQAILKQDVKLSQLSTPSEIRRYAEQYLALSALNPPSVVQTFSVTDLFGDSSSEDSLFGVIGSSLSASI